MEEKKIISVREFFDIWKSLIRKSKKDWEVIPETSVHASVSEENQTPIITYKIKQRKCAERSARKPSYKGTYDNKNQDKSIVVEYAQKFQTIIQFGIYGSTYDEADQTREEFERFMIDYLGHFRKEGILELIFEKQFEDENIEVNGQDLSKQTLDYYIRTANVVTTTNAIIEKIKTKLNMPEDFKYVQDFIKDKK